MIRIRYSMVILLVLLVVDVRTQFFDFFGFQPVLHQYQTITIKPTIQEITTERTTKRNNRRKTSTKSTTAISYESHDLEKDGIKNIYSSSSKGTTKRIRKTTESPFSNFHLYSTSVKPIRKTTKIAEISSSHNIHKQINEKTTRNNINNYDISNNDTSTRKYDNNNDKHSTSKETIVNKQIHYEKPISSNIADKYYSHTNKYNLETVTITVHTHSEYDGNKNNENDKKLNINTGSNNRNDNYYSETSNTNTDKYNNVIHHSTNRPVYNNHDYDNNQQSYTTKRPSYAQADKDYKYSNQQSHTTKIPDYNNYDNNEQKSSTTRRPSYSQDNNGYDYNNQGVHTTKGSVNSQNNNNDYSVNQQQYTTKYPEYNQHTTKSQSNYDYNNEYYNNNNYNYHTTKNPLMHRPGVRPAVVENRPPITNRPLYRPTTRKPIAVFPRPTDAGSISFPEDVDGPEVITGPDEDYMSEVEKRRYIETSEKMCDKYKSLDMKQLQAIPLIPSPEPVQVNISNCAPTNVPLVVGGKVVTINEFPHMALLGWVKLEDGGYSWKCGGSLISDQYVLTAAHCAYQERDNTVVIGAPRVVQLGSSYLDDPGALVVRISAVIRHPKFKTPKSYHDIALVKLVRPVQFSEVIKPACLGEPPPPGQPIIATGWGQTKFAGDQSLELRSVSLPVWDMESCANVLGTSRKLPSGPMSDNQVCAGDRRGGKDTCQGDSGGPAQLQEGCIWRVVAVTSLGRSCGAPNTPGLYAKVQRAFIAAQVFGGGHRNQQNRNINRNNNRDSQINNQQSNNNNRNGNSESVDHYTGIHNDDNYHSNSNDYSKKNQYSTSRSNIYDNIHDNSNNNNRNNRQETTSNSNNYNQNNNEKQTTRHDYDQTNESNNRRGNHHTSVARNMNNNNNNYENNNNNYENNNDNYENNNKYYNYNTGYFDVPSWT